MQVEISFKTVLKFIFNQDFTAQKRYNYVFQKYFLTMKVFSHSFPFHRKQSNHHSFSVCSLPSHATLFTAFTLLCIFCQEYKHQKVQAKFRKYVIEDHRWITRKSKQVSPQAGLEEESKQELVVGSVAATHIQSRVEKIEANMERGR